MISIQSQTQGSDVCTPNILPCRIHHNGPAKVTKRYWAPSSNKDGTQTSYFRGRKLRGRTVKIPRGYEGLVTKSSEQVPQLRIQPLKNTRPAIIDLDGDSEDQDGEDEQEQDEEPVKKLEKLSSFKEVVVWGHDQLPAADDSFVKGVEEWIAFAQAIHGGTETKG